MNGYSKSVAVKQSLRAVWLVAVLVGWSLVSTASATIITSFTYTYNPSAYTPSPSYPDATGTQLNDDVIPSASAIEPPYRNVGWVGTLNGGNIAEATPEVDLTFDKKYDFTSITVTYLADTGDGVRAPVEMDLSFSKDGVSYSAPVAFTGFTNVGSPATEQTTFDLTGYSAQYINAVFTQVNSQYTFLGELDFTGDPSPIPEPSVVMLIGLGGCLVWRKLRR